MSDTALPHALPDAGTRGLPVMAGLCLALAAASALWLFHGLPENNRAFILHLRLVKLGTMLVVAAGVGVSTILFQTVTANRVLTPSIMGFDSLYVLLQTALVATLGVAGFAGIATVPKFLAEVALISALSVVLFGTLLGRGTRDIARTVLTGVILGVMFRSASGLLTRLMDPNEFAVVQSAAVVSFTRADPALLPVGAALCATGVALALWLAPRLDVLALGRDRAVSLGLRHGLMVAGVLALVALLVAVATALVGPLSVFGPAAFFGLVVAGLAHGLLRDYRHALLLPASALVAANILVIGQLLFERLLHQQATLPVVIEFAGGLLFLYMLMKGRIR